MNGDGLFGRDSRRCKNLYLKNSLSKTRLEERMRFHHSCKLYNTICTIVGVCSLQSVQIVPYLVARSLLQRESTAAQIHIYIMIMVASSCQSVYICTRTFAKGANTLGT